MPFSIRPYRRFPVCCPVTYHAGLFEGQGIVWNLSVNGWRLSGGSADATRGSPLAHRHTPE
jgi:hypothetical protein